MLDPLLAKPRAVVERTILLVKRWRKLRSGHIYLKEGDMFVSWMVVIASIYANYLIDKLPPHRDDDEYDHDSDDVSDSESSDEFSSEESE